MRNKYLCAAPLLYFLSFTSFAYAAPVTLEDAFKAAVAKTEAVSIAQSQLRQSEAKVDEVRGNFLPSFSAGATYQRQDKEIGSTGGLDQATAKLTLAQSLYAGGRDRANLSAADFERISQEYNVVNSKNTLYIAVAKSFYALLAAKDEVANTQKSIDLTKQRIAELRKRKKIGKSRNIEVSAAEAQLSVLEAQLLAAIGERRIAKNNFANATGLDRDAELADATVLPTEVQKLKIYLATIDQRPDVLGLRASVESSDYRIRAASAGHLPSLDLTGNYYPYRYRLLQNSSDWDVMLALTIPLYSGGSVQAQVRDFSEQKIQTELLLKQRVRDSERDIHTAYNNLVSSLEQVKALEKAVAATEQNYREQEKDYRYSLATNLDVLQALNTLHDTQQTLDRTRYQALNALADLKAASNQIEQ